MTENEEKILALMLSQEKMIELLSDCVESITESIKIIATRLDKLEETNKTKVICSMN